MHKLYQGQNALRFRVPDMFAVRQEECHVSLPNPSTWKVANRAIRTAAVRECRIIRASTVVGLTFRLIPEAFRGRNSFSWPREFWPREWSTLRESIHVWRLALGTNHLTKRPREKSLIFCPDSSWWELVWRVFIWSEIHNWLFKLWGLESPVDRASAART